MVMIVDVWGCWVMPRIWRSRVHDWVVKVIVCVACVWSRPCVGIVGAMSIWIIVLIIV